MTVGSADRQKPTQKLDELLAQKTHKVHSLGEALFYGGFFV